jgi:hypothetical protein
MHREQRMVATQGPVQRVRTMDFIVCVMGHCKRTLSRGVVTESIWVLCGGQTVRARAKPSEEARNAGSYPMESREKLSESGNIWKVRLVGLSYRPDDGCTRVTDDSEVFDLNTWKNEPDMVVHA